MESKVLILTVIIPIFGAFLLPLCGRISEKFRNFTAVMLGASMLAGAGALTWLVLNGVSPAFFLPLPLGFGLDMYADYLAVIMAMVTASVGLIILIFSVDYISHYKNRTEYYVMVVLFLGSMLGLIFSMNLVWLYAFWEITGVCSWRLVGFFRGEKDVKKAEKTILVTLFGALCMLLGFIIIYSEHGTLNLHLLKGQPLNNTAVLLILAGIFAKSATLPFSTWLPDAGVAPAPVTALLHAAVLVKIGVYAYARLFCATFTIDPIWQTIVPAIAAASAIIAAGAALIETDLKRIIAYSTISQIGFIFLGLGVDNRIGLAGGMLYILMHGVAKGGLFLCAGIIEQNAKTKDIRKMGGLFSTMPYTALSFAFCSLSVMGIPPFGGFFSKFMVFQGAAMANNTWITFAFLAGAMLTIMYLFRVFYYIFMGELKADKAREGSATMVASVAVLGIASLLLGIFINYPAALVTRLCDQLGKFII